MEHRMDKKSAKRQLWIEYAKGAVTVLVFLAGLALVSNFINIYFAVKFGFGFNERPWYSNFVQLISIIAYMFVFVSGYKKLGLKVTDRIDDLKTIIDRSD
ncbi:MAG: hypothetical protein APF81_10315 [Desulfosporosinus sp. BRH_c37]|nr:MAG: hypothetical protein APF81_10315 [Desulfosporosinus sp. BRH_c37]